MNTMKKFMYSQLTELAIATIKVNNAMEHLSSDETTDVYVFEQVWGSTALGFGGWGGSSMTPAWTHVVKTSNGKYHVFFNGSHAYTVENPTEKFKEDLSRHCMGSIADAKTDY